jgi:TolA-binding protein
MRPLLCLLLCLAWDPVAAAATQNLEQARQDYQKVIAKDAASSQGRQAALELGKLDYAQGKIQEAAALLEGVPEEALEVARRPELIFWRAQAHLLLKEVQRAQDEFESLLKNYPEYVQADSASLSVADCDAALGNHDAALKGYQKLYQEPASSVAPQALWQAASLDTKLGHGDEARTLFERLVKRYPDSFEASKARETLATLALIPTPAPTPASAATVPKRFRAHFSVQVGAYGQRSGAVKLWRKLKKSGYAARVEKHVLQDSVFHVVRVGRFTSKAAAEKLAKRIHAKERLTFLIVETP